MKATEDRNSKCKLMFGFNHRYHPGILKAKSIINCDPSKKSIKNAIEALYSKNFRKKLPTIINPYGEGDAVGRIITILKNEPIPKELKKEFHDL